MYGRVNATLRGMRMIKYNLKEKKYMHTCTQLWLDDWGILAIVCGLEPGLSDPV